MYNLQKVISCGILLDTRKNYVWGCEICLIVLLCKLSSYIKCKGGFALKKDKITAGILIGNIFAGHSDDMLNGLVHAAEDNDMNLLFFMGVHANCFDDYATDKNEERFFYQFSAVFDYAKISGIDILIIAYSTFYLYIEESKEDFFKRFEDFPVPIIIVGDEYKDYLSVITDNRDGIRKCMEHLIVKHGYTKIVYLSGPKENNKDSYERLCAYYDVMKEHGLEVTDFMVEYGDYSANSAPLFGKLLDNNPGVEAVVCANDTMAIAGYGECINRQMAPGTDIAITGFDDIPEAKTVNPPLTTIEQNSYDLGYMAIKKAVDLYYNDNHDSVQVPVYFKHRESCRRKISGDENEIEILEQVTVEELAEKYCNQILDKVFLYKMSIIEDKLIWNYLHGIMVHIFDNYINKENPEYDMEFIDAGIRELVNSKKIAVYQFSMEFCKQIIKILFFVNDEEKRKGLDELIIHIMEFIQDMKIVDTDFRMDTLQRNIWTIPFITRDMVANIDNMEHGYEELMKRLQFMVINNAYLFLLKEPIVCNNIAEWSCPRELELVAKIQQGSIEFTGIDVKLNKEQGIADIISWDNSNNIMGTYTLFSRNRVYGILVCEVTSDNITSMYSASLHMGSTFRYIEVVGEQRKIQKELENAMEILKNKNDILNMISEKDELTGLYNRRGFLENAITCLQKQSNYVLCLYADLDHLKEINDVYGHTEGDFAIRQAGIYLKESMRNADIIGRIGGDEFAAVAIIKEEAMGEQIRDRIILASKIFNQCSDKPYYIEVSIGYAVFRWESGLELNQMLSKADYMLYESKIHRRKTIKK